MNVHLRSDLPPEQLEGMWLDLEAVCERAEEFIKAQRVVGENATGAESKAKFAARMDVLTESFCVLQAWTSLLHSAWVFATHGTRSVFFEGTPMAEYSGAPEVLFGDQSG